MANSADAKDEGLVFHPMDQFIVEPLFGAGPVHWYTVTNVTLWMALSVVALISVSYTHLRAHETLSSTLVHSHQCHSLDGFICWCFDIDYGGWHVEAGFGTLSGSIYR